MLKVNIFYFISYFSQKYVCFFIIYVVIKIITIFGNDFPCNIIWVSYKQIVFPEAAEWMFIHQTPIEVSQEIYKKCRSKYYNKKTKLLFKKNTTFSERFMYVAKTEKKAQEISLYANIKESTCIYYFIVNYIK